MMFDLLDNHSYRTEPSLPEEALPSQGKKKKYATFILEHLYAFFILKHLLPLHKFDHFIYPPLFDLSCRPKLTGAGGSSLAHASKSKQ
jgi:hypothetical protein